MKTKIVSRNFSPVSGGACKKGSVGETLTWFVAILVVFFILALFLSSTFVLKLKKGGDNFADDKITFQKLESMRDFVFLTYSNEGILNEILNLSTGPLSRYTSQVKTSREGLIRGNLVGVSFDEKYFISFDSYGGEFILETPVGYFIKFEEKTYFYRNMPTTGLRDVVNSGEIPFSIFYKGEGVNLIWRSKR